MSCSSFTPTIRPKMRSLTVAALSLAMGIILGVAACSRKPVVEHGSYPAVNPNDCLPATTLLDQHGNKVLLSSLKGRPVLIDFIYTTCPGPCPLITAKLVAVAKLLGPKLGKRVTFVSVTIDPEHDRPPELLRYAHESGADHPGWLFLTGQPAQINHLLAMFHMRVARQKNGAIQHPTEVFLLGPNGHQVRQYEPFEVKAATVVADIDRVIVRG